MRLQIFCLKIFEILKLEHIDFGILDRAFSKISFKIKILRKLNINQIIRSFSGTNFYSLWFILLFSKPCLWLFMRFYLFLFLAFSWKYIFFKYNSYPFQVQYFLLHTYQYFFLKYIFILYGNIIYFLIAYKNNK